MKQQNEQNSQKPPRIEIYRKNAVDMPMRYIARFTLEAESTIRIGAGGQRGLEDNPVVLDVNGFPYIPGTSIAGVIRHALEEETGDDIVQILGSPSDNLKDKDDDEDDDEARGLGSRMQFSSAYLLATDGKYVHQGLDLDKPDSIDLEHEYYQEVKSVRDNVAITHKGTAKQHAKYQTRLVLKGTRFVCEIELVGSKKDRPVWSNALGYIQHQTFRVGAGTRNGFGRLKVLKCESVQYDLSDERQMRAYLDKSSSLNSSLAGAKAYQASDLEDALMEAWEEINIRLKAADFFLFGAGEEEARPKKENFFQWGGAVPRLREAYLIPATSIKGALAHRTAFHYNKIQSFYIEESGMTVEQDPLDLESAISEMFPTNLSRIAEMTYDPRAKEWDELEAKIKAIELENSTAWQSLEKVLKSVEIVPKGVGEQNQAVNALFGSAKKDFPDEEKKKAEQGDEKRDEGHRGKILFEDAYLEEVEEKILNHVAIDRFTGGGIDGALFSASVASTKAATEFKIFVQKSAFKADKNIEKALRAAIKDLEEGRLQLGGQTTKGHGVFQATKKIAVSA